MGRGKDRENSNSFLYRKEEQLSGKEEVAWRVSSNFCFLRGDLAV